MLLHFDFLNVSLFDSRIFRQQSATGFVLLCIFFYPTKMTSQKSFKLNTGAQIPAIGIGTWQDENAQEAAVLAALKAGYRHIDTARW